MRAAAVQAFLSSGLVLVILVVSAAALRAPCNILFWAVVGGVVLILLTFEAYLEAYILFDPYLRGTNAGEKTYKSFL